MNDASTLTERATHDPRLQSLREWLERDLGFRDYGIAPASADASFRRYFRVTRAGHEPVIVMDAPPGKEDVGPYLRVAAMLQQIGVNAPRVLGRSEQDGFLLLTDLGTTMYLPELANAGRADALYADAITALVRIQARGAEAARTLPPYDEKLLRFEMSLFPDWLLQRHLHLELSARESRVLHDAMDAPPGKEDVGPYVRVAALLQQCGVNAPRVIERSADEGFLLLTDLGTTMYLAELALPGRADPLYADAISALVRIQANGAEAARTLPPYDEKLLRFEMSLLPDWLLQRHLQLELSAHESRVLDDAMTALVANALEQPQVFVHRDYHSRNLMVCPADNPGILDFQDAVQGPL
ncbi:MAG TPA: phosphotransferase, partial [Steroidobacteraceae bacterium]|nr:phosphotransferase [Steroidobacteraceae bacterium]